MYDAEINRVNPSAFLFLIDQSGSMQDKNESGKTLSEMVADSINRILSTLITKCSKNDIKDYFDVGVIAYGNEGCYNGFKGTLGGKILNKISEINNHPLCIETRQKKVDDGAGGLVDISVKFPIWFEPIANGGTPMCEAFTKAAEELVYWCDSHPDSFPPILINITDGEPTDGDPEEIAKNIMQISTNDGNVLVFNVHITKNSLNVLTFSDSENNMPNENAKRLFRMSSLLTTTMQSNAKDGGFSISVYSKGYCYNADISTLINFLDIGTRASNLR